MMPAMLNVDTKNPCFRRLQSTKCHINTQNMSPKMSFGYRPKSKIPKNETNTKFMIFIYTFNILITGFVSLLILKAMQAAKRF